MYSTLADFSGSASFPAVSPVRLAIIAGSPMTAGTPARVTSEIESSPGIYKASPAQYDDGVWGIVESDLAFGESGFMLVSGVIRAAITGGGTGKYVYPLKGRLAAGDSGRGEIISPNGEDGFTTILLGGGSGIDKYRKYFKLTALGNHRFAVINGAEPSSKWCGTTRIPGCEYVPNFEFELTELIWTPVYLCALYDDASDSYSVRFRLGSKSTWYEGEFTNIQIGTVESDGSVSQTYNDFGWNLKEYYL